MVRQQSNSVPGGVQDDHEGAGYLPFEYIKDFFGLISKPESKIRSVHYGDLSWNNNFDLETMYNLEWEAWRAAKNAEASTAAHILLQFDLDAEPDRGMNLLRLLRGTNLRASVMLFNRRINRRHLRESGEVVFTPYELDKQLIRLLQESGQVSVGYHTNAMEQSRWQAEEAIEIFEDDVISLRNNFEDVSIFSPHGGVPGPSGENNHDLNVSSALQQELQIRWVHNRRAPRFESSFSDGGFRNLKREAGRLNFTDFTKDLALGQRARVLIHPQYLSFPGADVNIHSVPLHVLAEPWYQEIIGHYRPDQMRWALRNRLNQPDFPRHATNPWDRFSAPAHPKPPTPAKIVSKVLGRIRLLRSGFSTQQTR